MVSPISGGSISYRLNEDVLGQSLTLQEWLDWTATQTIFHTDLNNQTVEDTYIELFEVFDFLLDDYFQLDAIIY